MAVNTGYPDNDPLFRHIPNRAEIEGICKDYALGTFVHNHGDLGGAYNVNLKIETNKGMYVIRIAYGLASAEHIQDSLKVLSVLNDAKIPVLFPLKNDLGKHYSKYKDRLIQVTPYINGKPFENTIEHANTSGRLLRKIHDNFVSVEDAPIPEWSNYPSKEILLEGLALLKQIDNIPEDLISKVERLHERVAREWNEYDGKLPSTIIHGDWHNGNVLFGEDGEIEVVMDFDFVQRAERLHDVAYNIFWALLSNTRSHHLCKAFLEGYGNLSLMEKEILPVAIARASLFFLCTSSFTPNPIEALNLELEKQEPFIEWLLSNNGRSAVADLL